MVHANREAWSLANGRNTHICWSLAVITDTARYTIQQAKRKQIDLPRRLVSVSAPHLTPMIRLSILALVDMNYLALLSLVTVTIGVIIIVVGDVVAIGFGVLAAIRVILPITIDSMVSSENHVDRTTHIVATNQSVLPLLYVYQLLVHSKGT